jgi:hypothetical protein
MKKGDSDWGRFVVFLCQFVGFLPTLSRHGKAQASLIFAHLAYRKRSFSTDNYPLSYIFAIIWANSSFGIN